MEIDKLNINETDAGVVLPVKAQPSSKNNCISGVHDGMLKISITAAPDKGKANLAIIRFLAKILGVSKTNIDLVKGDTSRKKLFQINGVTEKEVLDMLNDYLRE